MPLTPSPRSLLGFTVPARALDLFFDTLAVQLEAGRSIADALLDASACAQDGELLRIGAATAPMLRNGASLCASLRPYAARFPEIVLPVLEVGEASGSLAGSARRLAETFQQSAGTEREMKVNVYNPWLCLLGFCLIDALFLIIKAIGMPQDTHSLAAVAVSTILGVAIQAAELVAAYALGRAFLLGLYRWQPLRVWVDKIKLALPQLGPISRRLSLARWARSFATLWGAGINISSALEISSRSALNAYYEQALRAAAAQTRVGRTLSQSLAGTQLLPPFLLNIIATSETVGRMDDQLLNLARDMEREALAQAILVMNRIVIAAQLVFYVFAFVHSAL